MGAVTQSRVQALKAAFLTIYNRRYWLNDDVFLGLAQEQLKAIAGAAYGSGSPTSDPGVCSKGDLYIDTDTGNIYVYKGTDWEAVGGGFVSAPVTSGDAGSAGQMAYDGTYVYLCVAADTWVRWSVETAWGV